MTKWPILLFQHDPLSFAFLSCYRAQYKLFLNHPTKSVSLTGDTLSKLYAFLVLEVRQLEFEHVVNGFTKVTLVTLITRAAWLAHCMYTIYL